MKQKLYIGILLAFLLSGIISIAQIPTDKIPSRPNPPKLVNDFADILSDGQEESLENKLVAFNDSTSTQIAVVTVESLNGYPIEDFALGILRNWGIGQKEQDNGVLLLVSEGDREVRIETGSGSEGFLTDALSRRIIENQIVPQFQNGNYFNGINDATDQMMLVLSGQFYNEKNPTETKNNTWIFILIIFIIIFIISRRNKNGGGGVTYGRRGPTYWGGGGFGGFGGGGGGGGFGGFGGGFGGGGGASGRW